MRKFTRPLLMLPVCLVFGVALIAQGPDDRPVPTSNFGISDEAISTVSGLAFSPVLSTTNYSGDVNTGRWVTGGTGDALAAPIPEIPNGAMLTQVVFYVQDTDGAIDFTGRLCRHWTDSATGTNPASDCPVTLSTSGSPGSSFISSAPNMLISYRFNVDASGGIESVSYTLSGNWNGSTNGSLRLQHVRLLWRRQVTPAPATATFADVPVGSPFHRFVEALVASGVTGGCGSGNYCPDAPVTRGQMAVFLSAALGLHWPAF